MSTPARETIRRTWNAPLALVWELWTTPEGFGSWHGPPGFRTDVTRMDLRPGGDLAYQMTAEDPAMVDMMQNAGRPTSWPAQARITEVEPMTRFAYVLFMPMGPGADAPRAEVPHVVTLTETADGVEMVLELEAPNAQMLRPAAGGYKASFGRMEAVLSARA
jgi:uncharacterized protein YndB with AHSA1/START domain